MSKSEYLKNQKYLQNINRKKEKSYNYWKQGRDYFELGQYEKALRCHKKSLKIDQDLNNHVGVSDSLTGIGNDLYRLGNFRESIKFHNMSLKIKKHLSDLDGVANCYGNLGLSYDGLGNYLRALKLHRQSLRIKKQLSDKEGESSCLINLGNVYLMLGKYGSSIDCYDDALKLQKYFKNNLHTSYCFTGLGNSYRFIGDYSKSIEYHKAALEIYEKSHDPRNMASCFENLGNVYSSLANFYESSKYYDKALKIYLSIKDKFGISNCYLHLGNTYDDLEEYDLAIKFHKKSIVIKNKIHDVNGVAGCHMGIGSAFSALGEYSNALKNYYNALYIFRHAGNLSGKSMAYENIGLCHEDKKMGASAIKFYKKALKIAIKINDIYQQSLLNYHLGRMYQTKDFLTAYEFYNKSIELSEWMGSQILEEEHKISFYGLQSKIYSQMISLCLSNKKKQKSFEFFEKSKSKAFLEIISNTKIKTKTKSTALKLLLQEEEEILSQIRGNQLLHSKSSDSVMPGQIETLRKKRYGISNKIRQLDPEYAFLRQGKPLTLKKIKNLIHDDYIIIEYFYDENQLHIFIITKTKLYVETIDLPKNKLEQYFENFKKEVIMYGSDFDIGQTWLELSSYLVEPISKYLDNVKMIYFIPHGLLYDIPIHVLEIEGESLISKYSISYLPSASILQFLKNKGTNSLKSCFSFGVDFPDEARKVSKLFNTHSFINATKKTVLANLNSDILHFSCHGHFIPKEPLSSGIQLHDEILSARDIFKLEINSELVTLSSCESGLNNSQPGSELIGLTRAFFYAGVSSVIVSLWPVDSKSTQDIMIAFYKNLQKGFDKAESLQKAQNEIRKKHEYSHPYYWAPFILVGNN